MSEKIYCCGIAVEEDEYQIFEDRILCDTCLEERTTVCDHCGRVIHYDNAHYDDDEDFPYCERCFAKLRSRCIHQYN